MIFGAIDVGTNAARMLIGEICKSETGPFMKKISYTRIPLRLGEDVFENGKISEKKSRDFVKTMECFKLISEIFMVDGLRLVSTSAMREAKNASSIINKIKETTGLNLEIISGKEEAQLILGAFELLNIKKSKTYIVIDVGGGSTEISIFSNGKRTQAQSFEIGTIRLLKEKVQTKIWEEITLWIKENVDVNKDYLVFGTGGNINKIHKLIGDNMGDSVKYGDIKEFYQKIKELKIDDRITQFKLKPDRADVIVPALKIYIYIMKKLKVSDLHVPKIGLSDGVIYNFYKRSKNVK